MDAVTLRGRNLSPGQIPSLVVPNPVPRNASLQESDGSIDNLTRDSIGCSSRNRNLPLPLAFQMLGREQNTASFLAARGAPSPFDGFGQYPASPVSPGSLRVLRNSFLPADNEPAEDDDAFRMFDFKVRRCTKGKSHDWTECPFAHPGEKASRRDPRLYDYSGTPCADFRKGSCLKGDACEFAHGVFECWLHPERYRTQLCKDGRNCKRKVCFFAHTPDQLRCLPAVIRQAQSHEASFKEALNEAAISSPTSTLVGYSRSFPCMFASSRSPPMSPDSSHPSLFHNVLDHNSSSASSPSSLICPVPVQNTYFQSVPSMSALISDSVGLGSSRDMRSQDLSDLITSVRKLNMEEPIAKANGVSVGKYHVQEATQCLVPNYATYLEPVESGRALRAEIYGRLLSKKIHCEAAEYPNLDWISELVK